MMTNHRPQILNHSLRQQGAWRNTVNRGTDGTLDSQTVAPLMTNIFVPVFGKRAGWRLDLWKGFRSCVAVF